MTPAEAEAIEAIRTIVREASETAFVVVRLVDSRHREDPLGALSSLVLSMKIVLHFAMSSPELTDDERETLVMQLRDVTRYVNEACHIVEGGPGGVIFEPRGKRPEA